MEHNQFILGKDEKIIQIVYKHWVAVAPFIFVSIVLSLLSFFGVYYFARYQPSIGGLANSLSVIFAIIILMILIGLFTVAVIWVWHSNKVVLTNENIIDIDQLGLFRRNVSTLSLANIQDVSIQIEGPVQTILRYGKIIVQTAGERENFNLDYVPKPYEIERVIAKLHKQYHKKEPNISPLGKILD